MRQSRTCHPEELRTPWIYDARRMIARDCCIARTALPRKATMMGSTRAPICRGKMCLRNRSFFLSFRDDFRKLGRRDNRHRSRLLLLTVAPHFEALSRSRRSREERLQEKCARVVDGCYAEGDFLKLRFPRLRESGDEFLSSTLSVLSGRRFYGGFFARSAC